MSSGCVESVDWTSTRKSNLLTRAAIYKVPGVDCLDASGKPVNPPSPFYKELPNVTGSLAFIPRMVNAEKWYQFAVRGHGAGLRSDGPFDDHVKGHPVADGLDLCQTRMPVDLKFCEPGAEDIDEFFLGELDRKMLDPRAVSVSILRWDGGISLSLSRSRSRCNSSRTVVPLIAGRQCPRGVLPLFVRYNAIFDQLPA
jgi:hypothetical protein